jgi:hypothetical protein
MVVGVVVVLVVLIAMVMLMEPKLEVMIVEVVVSQLGVVLISSAPTPELDLLSMRMSKKL